MPALGCETVTGVDIESRTAKHSMILNQLHAKQKTSNLISYFIPYQEDIEQNNFWRVGLGQNKSNETTTSQQVLFCKETYTQSTVFLGENYDKLKVFTSPEPKVATNLLNYLAYTYFVNWKEYCGNLTGNDSNISLYYNKDGIVNGNNILDIHPKELDSEEYFSLWFVISIILVVVSGVILLGVLCSTFYIIKTNNKVLRNIEEHELLNDEIVKREQCFQETINGCIEDIVKREQRIKNDIENNTFTVPKIDYMNHLIELEKYEKELQVQKELKKEEIKIRLENRKCTV
jgi:hypothetical protein